jgi:hypothetical protein
MQVGEDFIRAENAEKRRAKFRKDQQLICLCGLREPVPSGESWLRLCRAVFFCGKKIFLTITTTASCKFGLKKNACFGRKTGCLANKNDTFFRGFSILRHY